MEINYYLAPVIYQIDDLVFHGHESQVDKVLFYLILKNKIEEITKLQLERYQEAYDMAVSEIENGTSLTILDIRFEIRQEEIIDLN